MAALALKLLIGSASFGIILIVFSILSLVKLLPTKKFSAFFALMGMGATEPIN
jgi:hypothetical protein